MEKGIMKKASLGEDSAKEGLSVDGQGSDFKFDREKTSRQTNIATPTNCKADSSVIGTPRGEPSDRNDIGTEDIPIDILSSDDEVEVIEDGQNGATKETPVNERPTKKRKKRKKSECKSNVHEGASESIKQSTARSHRKNIIPIDNNRTGSKNMPLEILSSDDELEKDDHWEKQFYKLKEFMENTGHCVVPRKFPHDLSLQLFVEDQCRQLKADKITADRKDWLKDLGFTWVVNDDKFKQRSKPLQIAFEKRWESRFQQFLKHKEKHGHSTPGIIAKPLGKWVNTQRFLKRKNELRDDRRKKLDDIGFQWDAKSSKASTARRIDASGKLAISSNHSSPKLSKSKRDSNWNKRYQELIKFQSENGHCNVPFDYKGNSSLNRWVYYQRVLYKDNKMPASHIAYLEKMGFDWELPPKGARSHWDKRYQELIKFQLENGHCEVPPDYKGNSTLNRWVYYQRVLYRENKMPTNHIGYLEKLGFDWELPPKGITTKRNIGTAKSSSPPKDLIQTQQKKEDVEWEKFYEELVKFHAENCHCSVPKHHKLGYWVDKQRLLRKEQGLSARCVKKLGTLGFEWSTALVSSDNRWLFRFNQLADYKRKNWHTILPSKPSPLVNWVKMQRVFNRNGLLAEDHKKKLDGIGFTWDENIGTSLQAERAKEGQRSAISFEQAQIDTLDQKSGRSLKTNRGTATNTPADHLERRDKEFSRGMPLTNATTHPVLIVKHSSSDSFIFDVVMPPSDKILGLVLKENGDPRIAAQAVVSKVLVSSPLRGIVQEGDFLCRLDATSAAQMSYGSIKSVFRAKKVERKCLQMSFQRLSTSALQCQQVKSAATNCQVDGGNENECQKNGAGNGGPQLKVSKYCGGRWNTFYKELLKFYSNYGHFDVPRSHPDYAKLAHWAEIQRLKNQKNLLLKDRYDSLNKIGFVWSRKKCDQKSLSWNSMYNELVRYKEEHGNFDIPSDRDLGKWASRQRHLCVNRTIRRSRHMLLEEVGFIDWNQGDAKGNTLRHICTGVKGPNPLEKQLHKQAVIDVTNISPTSTNIEADHVLSNEVQEFLPVVDLAEQDSGKSGTKIDSQGQEADSTAIDSRHDIKWERRYKELVDYKNATGSCDLAKLNRDNTSLRRWLNHQFRRKLANKLPDHQLELLREVVDIETKKDAPFKTPTRVRRWEESYKQFAAYYDEHGKLPPKKNSLRRWIKTQQHCFSKNRLSKRRLNRLNQLPFDWNSNTVVWKRRLNELIVLKSRCDDSFLRMDRSLHRWIQTQHRKFRNDELTSLELKLYRDLLLVLEKKKPWDSYFWQLVYWKCIHGHFFVPFDKNPVLNVWIKRQFLYQKQNKLDNELFEKLDCIGFKWEAGGRDFAPSSRGMKPGELWKKRFCQLVKFKVIFGHCNVFQKYSYKLYDWTNFQRWLFKNKKLTPNQEFCLDQLAFDFGWEQSDLKDTSDKDIGPSQCQRWWKYLFSKHNGLDIANQQISHMSLGDTWWEFRYSQCVEYKKQNNGHCNIPVSFKEFPTLGIWVSGQKRLHSKGLLSVKRYALLKSLCLNLTHRKEKPFTEDASQSELFRYRFLQLAEYYVLNGTTKVPPQYNKNPVLGKWVFEMCKLKRHKKLSNKHAFCLEQLNFHWRQKQSRNEEEADGWEQRSEELAQFKKIVGRMPCKITNADLANWVQNQRTKFKQKHLSEDRTQKLKELRVILDDD